MPSTPSSRTRMPRQRPWACRDTSLAPACASIHPASTKSRPPSSATNSRVAEDGRYSPIKGNLNLRHRRPNQKVAEDGRYTPLKRTPNLPPSAIHGPLAENGGYSPLKGDPNLRHRRSNQGVAEHGRYTPQKWIPNLHLRRPTKHSPKTEDTASRRIPNLPR